jgi:hypothetical protein
MSARFVAVVFACSVVACGGDDEDTRASGTGGASGGSGGSAGAAGLGGSAGAAGSGDLVWPNAESQATSDPWIVQHHDEIVQMRPRILALNFVNGRPNADMTALYEKIFVAIAEGTRSHAYSDANAKAFLSYEVAKAVDLTDATPPANWPYKNSTKYPREEPPTGTWGFDYGRLFTQEFADLYGIEDPDRPGKNLTLCELSSRGMVHEVWIYGDADVPDVSAAEILGIQPVYDASFQISADALNRCAGNGCFDQDDDIPAECTRTLRIGWVNNTRGVGCYLESLSHGIETIGQSNDVPYFTQYFPELGGFDLDARYGLPFDSWYACQDAGCLTYPTSSSVTYSVGTNTGTIDPYVPICGNAHFPPNAREHYDVVNPTEVLSHCRTHRRAVDEPALTSAADWSGFEVLASDCTGPWIVWWWQSFPGTDRLALADDASPMKNWWPFLFY